MTDSHPDFIKQAISEHWFSFFVLVCFLFLQIRYSFECDLPLVFPRGNEKRIIYTLTANSTNMHAAQPEGAAVRTETMEDWAKINKCETIENESEGLLRKK